MISHSLGKIAATTCIGVVALTAAVGCNSNGTSASASQPPATSAAPSAPATSAAPPASAPAASSAVLYNCEKQAVTQPASLILACGDGSNSLTGMTWSGWGSATATATGNYEEASCNPDCASGGQQNYPATITVSGLSNGSYTEMTISVPKHSPASLQYSFGPSGPTVK